MLSYASISAKLRGLKNSGIHKIILNGTVFRRIRILKWTKTCPFPVFVKWDEKWSQFFFGKGEFINFSNN